MAELSIEELVDDVKLEGIQTFELSIVADEDRTPPEDFELAPVYGLNIARSEDGTKFRCRVKTELDAGYGSLVVDASIEYSLAEISLSDVSEALLLEFANRIGVLALVPYIRQHIADLTARVFGRALTMPVIRSGELWFDGESTESA